MAGITAAQTVMAVAAMPAVMTLQGRLHRSAGTWHGRQCAPAGRHGGRRRSTFRRDRARRLADGSDWAKVIPLLQAKGVKVQAVQNGLNSLADDVAATRRAVGNQPGKAVLVGHSWGGTVITEAGADSKVAGLVYVAAFAPDAGQSTEEVGKDYAPAPGIGKLVAEANGYLSLPPAELASDFAQDVPAAQARVMAATQGPIKATAFGERTTVAAWQSKPSWFIVSAHDCMIQPDLEHAMARKIGAKVTTLPTSHVPQQSRPQDVAKVILDAVHAVEARN